MASTEVRLVTVVGKCEVLLEVRKVPPPFSTNYKGMYDHLQINGR